MRLEGVGIMTKNYTLPSGAELVLNHNISKPVLDVWQIKTEILLNGETLGTMTAYNGAVPALRRITDCFELNVFFNWVNKIYFKPYDKFTIITDVKIERDFAFERPTYFIFNKLFDYISDIGINAEKQVYANIVLIESEFVDEAVENIHQKLTMGLLAHVIC